MEPSFKIFTDGGCSGNPGPGGWAYVMVTQTYQGEQIISKKNGAQEDTTNNKMELTAVIMALRELNSMPEAPRQVTVFTDSQYVQKGMTEWIHIWKRKSWRTSDKTPVKNKDLWIELDSLSSDFWLKWEWIKGHAGNKYNELCDSMTQEAITQLKLS